MEFSNLFFLYLFFPLCAGIYFLAPGMKFKNGILLLFSLLFYCFDRPGYVPLVLLMALCNYGIPKLFGNKKLLSFLLCLGLNIGTLVFFKVLSLGAFPLGLSFYTFSLISYQIDIYRQPEERCDNIWQFLLFVTFFPKLIMGPITRYSQMASQLEKREIIPEEIFQGGFRFAVGLAKKILLADPLFRLYEQLGTHSSWIAPWCAGFAFMLYIYLEFSGYCDMAVGLGRVFGFRLPENFHRPYTASSVGQFWRRWHITLGDFFKDYVYIPMGGNRRGAPRQIINLFVVWLLTGLWHGISLTFVLWGMYFFVLISLEKLLGLEKKKLPTLIGWIFTFILAYFGWVIFAAEDVSSLIDTIFKMFAFRSGGLEPTFLVLRNSILVVSFGTIASVVGPLWKERIRLWVGARSVTVQKVVAVGQFLLIILLLGLCTVSLIGTAARPSMYAGF